MASKLEPSTAFHDEAVTSSVQREADGGLRASFSRTPRVKQLKGTSCETPHG